MDIVLRASVIYPASTLYGVSILHRMQIATAIMQYVVVTVRKDFPAHGQALRLTI